jgi:hypothetical protein
MGPASSLLPPRAGSQRGLHFTGSDVSDWGAGLSVALNDGKPVDLRGKEGVSIWLRADGAPTAVLVKLAIPGTLDATYGGTCQASSTVRCDDHYSAIRTASPLWTRFRIAFRDFHQLGFGAKAAWDPSQVVELHVSVDRGTAKTMSFDLWIDDISFF